MINYIRKLTSYKMELSKDGRIEVIDQSIKKWLQLESQASFRSIESVTSKAKKELPTQRKLPLWINNQLLFMVIHSLDSADALCINVYAILSKQRLPDGTLTVVFKDGTRINGISETIFRNQWLASLTLLKQVNDCLT